MFQLEKYRNLKSRYTCPACGSRNVFARYISSETGEYISREVGRCNRESKCGYHLAPKEFFAANPSLSASFQTKGKESRAHQVEKRSQVTAESNNQSYRPDYIDYSYFEKSLGNYQKNSFVKFLLNLFPEDRNLVLDVVKKYLVGTTGEGKTIFWQADLKRKIRTGKIINYDPLTGKRNKSYSPGWFHAELKKQSILPEDFNLVQCFFGEHLLYTEKEKTIALVEAEKTAVIASICFPGLVWLSVGSKQNLKAEKLAPFAGRKIILYPDSDGFKEWQKIALEARELGLKVEVSTLIETHASDQEKREGYDLADYLINEQIQVNEHNAFAARYNFALENVLKNKILFDQFNRAFDTQKANLMLYGGLSARDAELDVSRVETVRQIVLNVAERQNLNNRGKANVR